MSQRVIHVCDTEEWRDFFQEFRNLPILWNSKMDSYKNRNLRSKAWDELLSHYRKIVPEANVGNLKQKIANIRTQYRRELQLIRNSERSGASSEDVYVPSIWYFDILDFMKDDAEPLPSQSTDSDFFGDDENELNVSRSQTTKKPRKIDAIGERTQILKEVVQHLTTKPGKKDEDEADIFGKSWACAYRNLSGIQKIYAKKAIEEIFIYGQLNQLTLNSVCPAPTPSTSTRTLRVPTQFSSRSSTPVLTSTPSPTTASSDTNIRHFFALSDGTFAVPLAIGEHSQNLSQHSTTRDMSLDEDFC